MVTVVMSVYNGTRYLTEQLDSLRLQTVSPDRVLIADDCSTDGSFDHIVKYIEEHGLGNWTINKNRSNFGWRKSFKRLLDLASIDDGIVFPCDRMISGNPINRCDVLNPREGPLYRRSQLRRRAVL
ncbi:MAG: glycosyltransferase [Collinsella sp.]